MVKLVAFFKRLPEMSVDDFQQHWRTTHADLRASGRSPEYAATRADETNFMLSGRLPFVVASEHDVEPG